MENIMQNEQALALLGVDEGASSDKITTAYEAKLEQTHGLLNKAPTDGLKAKYQQKLLQLDEAKQLLSKVSETSEPPKEKSRPGMSQSKFEDIPNAAPRYSQFEERAQAELSIKVGQVLAGRYKIEEKIAAGGMGVVYRAFDQNRNEDIAIKVMLPSLVKNPRAREKFMDEARLSSKLSHPNIVNVYDVQNEGELYFLTMELLEGQDLRDVMENRKLTRQPFTKDEVIDLLKQVTAGLNHAHETTVHRDLKPENIFLTEDGEYKVMDFGIARVQSTSQRTQSGVVSGTAYYMAPEQVKGAKGVDARADQYAMAVFTYELLCGDVPTGMITPLHELRPDVGRGFSKAIERSLANKPEDRFDNLNEFLAALEKGGVGFSLPSFSGFKFDTESLALPAVILVGLLMVGGIVSSGAIDLGNMFMSKAEIAQRKGDNAKLAGEIKNLQKRLDNGRRTLDSDVRDAERSKTSSRYMLQDWQKLTENSIFDGDQLTELEGQLAMADTLLRDDSFDEAEKAFTQVKDGYASLYGNFQAGEHIYSSRKNAEKKQQEWYKLKRDYRVSSPNGDDASLGEMDKAKTFEREGQLSTAKTQWDTATNYWAEQINAAAGKVSEVKRKRTADANRKRQIAADKERRRKAEEERQRRLAADQERRRVAAENSRRKEQEERDDLKSLMSSVVSSINNAFYRDGGKSEGSSREYSHDVEDYSIDGCKITWTQTLKKYDYENYWTYDQIARGAYWEKMQSRKKLRGENDYSGKLDLRSYISFSGDEEFYDNLADGDSSDRSEMKSEIKELATLCKKYY